MRPPVTASDRQRGVRRKTLRVGLIVGGVIAGALLLSTCSFVFNPDPPDFESYGARCAQDDECASGRCVDNRCSESCSGECPEIDGVAVATCSSSKVCDFNSPPPLKGAPAVAFLYGGQLKVDENVYSGTNRAADLARLAVAREFDAETIGVENVSSSNAGDTIEQLVTDGYNVIIGTNQDHRTAVTTAANRFRDVNFIQIGAYIDFEAGYNVGSFGARMYSVTYLLGQAAARVSTTKRIGVVGPVALPETVANINAFARGAFKEDADTEVVVRWINDWESETLENRAVEELAAADCDVIFGYTDTTRPLIHAITEVDTTASGEDIIVIGYGTNDICEDDPRIGARCLTAAYYNWEYMLTNMIQGMIDGNWIPSRYWEAMLTDRTHSSASYVSFNFSLLSVAESLDIDNQIDDLARDPLLPFAGTIRDTANVVHENIDDTELMRMCWHVQGIMEISELTPTVVLAPLTEVPASCRSFD
jgi:basic membrane lipoprotein Med (substrate-binding protein (PBP1-ABC) superfamily)